MDETCTFCSTGGPDTNDHVPPKSFFPTPVPQGTRLITVPCCVTCHDKTKGTDGVLRNLFVSLYDTEGHPAIVGGLGGKRERSLLRGKHDLDSMLSMMDEVFLTEGTGPTPTPVFDFSHPLVSAFVERLARALLRFEFETPYFDGTFEWKLNHFLPNEIYEGFAKYGRVGKILDIFGYGVTPFRSGAHSNVVCNFYGSCELLIRVEKRPS